MSPMGITAANWSSTSPQSAFTTAGWRTGLNSTRGLSQLHHSEMCPWRWTPTLFTVFVSACPMAWGMWAMPFGRWCWQTQRKQAWRASTTLQISISKDERFPAPSSFCFSRCPIARWQLLWWGPWTCAHSHQSVGTYGLVTDWLGIDPLGTVKEKVWSQLTEVLCMEILTLNFPFRFCWPHFRMSPSPCHFLLVSLMFSMCCTVSPFACLTLWSISVPGMLISVGGGTASPFWPY